MRKIIGVCMVISLLLSGCKEQPINYRPKPVFSHSYVAWFMEVETLGVDWRPESSSISVNISGRGYEKDSPASDSLNNHFGDTSFDSLRSYMDESYIYLAEEFTAIEVISDRDFDDAHPAGTSLGDIVMFYGISAYPYIRSGYDDGLIAAVRQQLQAEFNTMDFKGHFFGRFGDMPIKKLLKDVTAEDLKLLFPSVRLQFTTPPPAGKHTFTITFKSAEKTLVSTLAVEIE